MHYWLLQIIYIGPVHLGYWNEAYSHDSWKPGTVFYREVVFLNENNFQYKLTFTFAITVIFMNLYERKIIYWTTDTAQVSVDPGFQVGDNHTFV